ncbi:MAG: hypothetical protein MZV63_59040 [Marinilabiliales bacterium]|nr:hypothetical protein [Marinilabiliales bacterium]
MGARIRSPSAVPRQQPGTFNYTIPLTGGCGTVNATGTITVTPANTVGAASSTPTLCIRYGTYADHARYDRSHGYRRTPQDCQRE